MGIDWEAATEELTDWLGQQEGVIDPVEASVAVVKAALGDMVLYRLPTKFERTHNYGLGPTMGETITVVRMWPENTE